MTPEQFNQKKLQLIKIEKEKIINVIEFNINHAMKKGIDFFLYRCYYNK